MPLREGLILFTMMDVFTSYPEVLIVPDKTKETLAKALFNGLICRHGVPVVLISDNEPALASRLLYICTRD